MTTLTPSQKLAVEARGNVLVAAGAGAGKTSTLVERIFSRVTAAEAPLSVERLLVVTFTEAAAAGMKHRLRVRMEGALVGRPADQGLREQSALLEHARISTLHAFCYRLVREHFQELGVDPQLQIMEETECARLRTEVLDELFAEAYEEPNAEAFRSLIRVYGGGSEERLRDLVVQLHRRAFVTPDPKGWMATQAEMWERREPELWRENLLKHVVNEARLCRAFARAAEGCSELEMALARLEAASDWSALIEAARSVSDAVDDKARMKAVKAAGLEGVVELARRLVDASSVDNGVEELTAEWNLVRPHMNELLRLATDFTDRFQRLKLDRARVEFSDLEQLALELLWNSDRTAPSVTALRSREQFDEVLVDECQDINDAQNALITALGREGDDANRFLVGDVKQSIYAFRLANPEIFHAYAAQWDSTAVGRVVFLSENFRSHEQLVRFINRTFAALMSEALGGVAYDQRAALQFGAPEVRRAVSTGEDSSARAELHLVLKPAEPGDDDEVELGALEREAWAVANRLRELKENGSPVWDAELRSMRTVEWRDMAILLRSPAGRSATFARVFARAGIPLQVAHGGFFDALEVADVLNLCRVLDNPRQDIPLLAVLRSPFVGLSESDLVRIRLGSRERLWWSMIREICNRETATDADGDELRTRLGRFLENWRNWRRLVRLNSLAVALEQILEESGYELFGSANGDDAGAESATNIRRFLEMVEQIQQPGARGLGEFLDAVNGLIDAGSGPERATAGRSDGVRLMSVHQSKGLEFPVVVVADLGKRFNLQDLNLPLWVSAEFGLVPRVHDVSGRFYRRNVVGHLAASLERRRSVNEEMRLLYVAMTRARDHLLLFGSTTASIMARKTLDAAPPMTRLSVNNWLDWLLPEITGWLGVTFDGGPMRIEGDVLRASVLEVVDTSAWSTGDDTGQSTGVALAEMREAVADAIGWSYPHQAETRIAAKTTVSRLRRQAMDDEAEILMDDVQPALKSGRSALVAATAGTATHLFLQHFAAEHGVGRAQLEEQLQQMVRNGILTEGDAGLVQLDRVNTFWSSPLGREWLSRRAGWHRELPFTAAFEPGEVGSPSPPVEGGAAVPVAPNRDTDDRVMVQGVVDLAWLGGDEIWMIDFKTDQVGEGRGVERVGKYRLQLELYRRALQRVYDKPVTRTWLVWLETGESTEVPPITER